MSVLEYEDDMKYFYKSGYGFEANERLNCRAMQDMLTRFNSKDLPNVILNVGHSTGVQTFITAMGINKDDIKLTATNYNQLTDRRWKTSNIDPFGANLVAVKYECATDLTDKEKAVFFLNQNAVDLNWCNVGLCNWSDVLKKYETFLNANCEDYYCKAGSSAVGVSMVALLLGAIVYLIY